jgi:hypothetical protein
MRKQPPGGRLFSLFFDPFLMASIDISIKFYFVVFHMINRLRIAPGFQHNNEKFVPYIRVGINFFFHRPSLAFYRFADFI